jgi:hypothetical protein
LAAKPLPALHKCAAPAAPAALSLPRPGRRAATTMNCPAAAAAGAALRSHGAAPFSGRLDLSFNEIESLGDKRGGLSWLVTSLPHIQELNLANNRLGSVPAELGELTSLRVLRLGSNGLHSLPAALKQLAELRELYLHGNKIPSDALEPILPVRAGLVALWSFFLSQGCWAHFSMRCANRRCLSSRS